jgi:hypothetical protein
MAAFLSEGSTAAPAPEPVREAPRTAGAGLPGLDEVLARVPPDVLGILDDLFRAKFTTVRRYDAEAAAPKSG